MSRLSLEIVEACESLGFAGAGICAARAGGYVAAFEAWLAGGLAGTMSWMHERTEQRLDIRGLEPGRTIRSVIVVADQYAAQEVGEAGGGGWGGGRDEPEHVIGTGRIARYARGRDYHSAVRKRLHALADRLHERFPGEVFRSFVDTGPVLEREHAARAGLGFIGKHTLLIDPRRGSYLLLGGMATSLELEPTASGEVESRCGTCTRCIDACPTHAIEPYRIDARRCISYLTIEHEGPIDPALHAGMGDWLFGCDICQEVCPYNAPTHPLSERAAPTKINPLYRERAGLSGGRLPLEEVLRWTPEERQAVLTVSAGKRASLDSMRRNAVIALGNQADPAHAADRDRRLEALAEDDTSEVVRQTARAVLERVRDSRARA